MDRERQREREREKGKRKWKERLKMKKSEKGRKGKFVIIREEMEEVLQEFIFSTIVVQGLRRD